MYDTGIDSISMSQEVSALVFAKDRLLTHSALRQDRTLTPCQSERQKHRKKVRIFFLNLSNIFFFTFLGTWNLDEIF